MGFILRLLGHKVAHKVAHQTLSRHVGKHGLLDCGTGFALFKDRSVPVSSKVLALGIGIACTVLLIAVEAPIEFLVGLLLPFVGVAADMLIDGVEFFVLPLLIACIVLPRIAPKMVVEDVRAELSGMLPVRQN